MLSINKNICARVSWEPDLTSPLRATTQLVLSRSAVSLELVKMITKCAHYMFLYAVVLWVRVEFTFREEQDAVAFVLDC